MKDVIYVENHYFVTVKENSIKFRNVIDKSEKFYLFEEIEAIIFDHYKSYFSHKLVIKCIENDIAIIFCDKKHSPLTQLISSYGMTHRLQRIQSQFQLSGRTRDRIWKKI
ncbi:TPA: CRISPR-associated endonuclease Cas1, partial [Staphylococcus pseudintermedius]|nr:CRISPR-associated endonuclease Cas1 [Staphylococcus pseudintermedius]